MFFSGIADEAGKPLETQIKAHQEIGFDHIEVRNVDETTLAYASDEEFDRIHARLNEAGLQVSCFASQLANWAREITGPLDKDIDELNRAIPRMKKMNTPFIRVMSWSNTKSQVPKTEWRDEAIKRMKDLARIAEDGGVTLVHENCDGWGGLGPEQTCELLAEVGSPAVKLVFDTGNCASHGQDTWAFYTGVKQHIAYVHIKDGRRDDKADKTVFTFPGEGAAEVPRIIGDLLRSGYDGGISIEPHIAKIVHDASKEPDPQQMYESYVKYGRMCVDIVNKAKEAAGA